MLARASVVGFLLIVAVTASARADDCLPETVYLVNAPDVTTWSPAPYRWRDIATNLYSASYQATYIYDSSSVAVTFQTCGDSTLTGHLSAVNLKPNFAYQVKLVGKPERLWGEEGDDETNERIGFTGRWWRLTPNEGNSNDADYLAHYADSNYIYEGYLLFDFFITDRLGSAELDFDSRSSFHVLFWEGQTTKGSCDSPTKWATVIGYAGDPAYDGDVGPTDVGVFAQIERLCYGTTTLPVGVYDCRFLLTEESFHQSGDTEGYWASAVGCDTVAFEVGTRAAVGASGGDAPWAIAPMMPNPFREECTLHLRLKAAGLATLRIYGVDGSLVREIPGRRVEAGDNALTWDGRDSEGNRLVGGLYFYRIEMPGGPAASGKVVLLRSSE